MNKKGASHIDWAVSMGIFLIYVLSMFMLIQPGIQDFYNDDTLVDIFEEALNNDAYYEITRVPVYLKVLQGQGGACGTGEYVVIPIPFREWDLTNGNINMSFNTVKENEGSISYISGSNADDTITFIPTHPMQKYRDVRDLEMIWLYYSPSGTPGQPGHYNIQANPADIEGKRPCGNIELNVGAQQKLIGVDPDKMGDLGASCDTEVKYQELKRRWKLPESKEFSLYYVEADTIPYDITAAIPVCNYGTNTWVSVPEQVDVYAKEWNEWILSPDGTMKPIIINFRIW